MLLDYYIILAAVGYVREALLTRSGPEGSSRSGDIVCRGVAGGAASKFKVLLSARPISCTSYDADGAEIISQ